MKTIPELVLPGIWTEDKDGRELPSVGKVRGKKNTYFYNPQAESAVTYYQEALTTLAPRKKYPEIVKNVADWLLSTGAAEKNVKQLTLEQYQQTLKNPFVRAEFKPFLPLFVDDAAWDNICEKHPDKDWLRNLYNAKREIKYTINQMKSGNQYYTARGLRRVYDALSRSMTAKVEAPPEGKPPESDELPNWGDIVRIEEPELDIMPRSAYIQKHYQPQFVGPLRYPHRALLPLGDGSAFALRRFLHRGTILIDMSGSMNWSQSEIEHLFQLLPAVTIALYGAICESGRRVYNGKISIVGRKFRMVREKTLKTVLNDFSGGNVIDLPALMWLKKQEGPHYWISDGCVTGRNEANNKTVRRECYAWLQTTQIKRLEKYNTLKSVNFSQLRNMHTEQIPHELL